MLTHLAAALDDEGEIDADRGGEWLHLVRVRVRIRAKARVGVGGSPPGAESR